MPLDILNGADPAKILNAIYSECLSEQVISLKFRCEIPPARLADHDHWLRLQGVLSHPDVYEAFGIFSLPRQASFSYATGLEVIGTLANLLYFGGVHGQFVHDYGIALAESRQFLDQALLHDYSGVEAYSSEVTWCDWFIGDDILDKTVLVGNRDEWWLLAVTGTD